MDSKTKKFLFGIKHAKPVIYGAFTPEGKACFIARMGKKEIPVIGSTDFILDCGGYKNALERIKSFGLRVSAFSEKPNVIALLS